MIKIAFIVLAIIGAFTVYEAFGAATPDTFEIVTAQGYGDVDETGDILLVIHYNVAYDVLPSETASEAIIGRYLDGTSPIRNSAPFVYVNQGFGNGVIGVYFDPTDATAFSLTHGDADSAEIIGNPSVYGAPWSVSKPITWVTQGSQSAFESDIAELALLLEEKTEWADQNLIQFDSGSNVFQTAGEDYFENSIPRIRQGASNLFATSRAASTVVERDFNQSYQTTLENAWAGSRLSGSFTGLSNWLGFPEIAIKTTLSAILAVITAGLLGVFMTNRGVSQETAAAAGFTVVMILISLAAMQGLFSLTLLAIIGFFGLLLIAGVLYLKRA